MTESSRSRARGALGESIACAFLSARGYEILARNFRAGRQELDIVARRGGVHVAIEVKWRRAGADSAPVAEHWGPAQRQRAHAAVLAAMAAFPGGGTWRMDLITLAERADGLELTHHRGAWSPGGSFW